MSQPFQYPRGHIFSRYLDKVRTLQDARAGVIKTVEIPAEIRYRLQISATFYEHFGMTKDLDDVVLLVRPATQPFLHLQLILVPLKDWKRLREK